MQVTLEDTLKSSFSVPVGLGQAYTQDASVDRPLVLLLLIKESSIFIVAISVLYMSTPASSTAAFSSVENNVGNF